MSLSVYLITEKPQIKKASSGIFVRENGQTKEITQEEWNTKNPNKAPVIFEQEEIETREVYYANITHNLNIMATEAGIYEVLWRPYKLREGSDFSDEDYDKEMEFEDLQKIQAKELIEPLRQGLHNLKSNPKKYKKFNPKNGWGSYEGLVNFVDNYLNACYEYPSAEVKISR